MIDFVIKAGKHARPMVIGIVGIGIVVTGIVMIALPGPGLLIILAGLAVLATEFIWARTLLARVKTITGKFRKVRKREEQKSRHPPDGRQKRYRAIRLRSR